MKFKVELIINLDESSSKFKIESHKISLIDVPNPQVGPIATLENNKIIFNKEALNLLGLTEGSRLGVGYSVLSDGLLHPVLNLEEGNKITKSGTVSCRGTANEILSRYGKEFIIEKFDDVFILTDSKFKKLNYEDDPNIELPPIDEELDLDSGSSQVIIDELLEELDETTPIVAKRDFFGNDEVDGELKDVSFASIIESL